MEARRRNMSTENKKIDVKKKEKKKRKKPTPHHRVITLSFFFLEKKNGIKMTTQIPSTSTKESFRYSL